MTEFSLYILRCRDGSLYTGVTNDLTRRLAVHGAGRGAKYVASRLPVELVYVEGPFACRGDAQRREISIKRMKKAKKESLLKDLTVKLLD